MLYYTVSVTILGVTLFLHMHSNVISEQMAIIFRILMQDILLIPEKSKSHSCQKFKLLCFGFVS